MKKILEQDLVKSLKQNNYNIKKVCEHFKCSGTPINRLIKKYNIIWDKKLKKGENHSNIMKGRKFSKEHIKNLKKNHKGMLGKKHSDETKKEYSKNRMGKKNAFYGLKHSDESKKKMSINNSTNRYIRKSFLDKKEYMTIHQWLYDTFGKANHCENDNCQCKNKKRFEWANVSGKYVKSIKDFIQLCSKCHKDYDKGYIQEKFIKKIIKKRITQGDYHARTI